MGAVSVAIVAVIASSIVCVSCYRVYHPTQTAQKYTDKGGDGTCVASADASGDYSYFFAHVAAAGANKQGYAEAWVEQIADFDNYNEGDYWVSFWYYSKGYIDKETGWGAQATCGKYEYFWLKKDDQQVVLSGYYGYTVPQSFDGLEGIIWDVNGPTHLYDSSYTFRWRARGTAWGATSGIFLSSYAAYSDFHSGNYEKWEYLDLTPDDGRAVSYGNPFEVIAIGDGYRVVRCCGLPALLAS